MANERSETLTFLYEILDDIQGTIRFLDTKAAFGIAILGGLSEKLLDPDQIAACRSHGPMTLFISVALGLLVGLSAFLGFRTVFPLINPAENVSFPDNLQPKFFVSELRPRRILRLFSSSKKFSMLKTTHAEYCAALDGATAIDLESVVAAEALKLSFICQLKTDRLQWFARLLIATVALFLVVVFAAPKAVPVMQVQILHDSAPMIVQAPQPPCNRSQTRQGQIAAIPSSPPASLPAGAAPGNEKTE